MSTKKQESTGSPAGRKPIISVDMVTKLEDALLNGMSDAPHTIKGSGFC